MPAGEPAGQSRNPARTRGIRCYDRGREPPRLEPERQRDPFVLKQPALAVQAAAEASQLAARPDHTVAGDDDGDGVLAVGGADGAGGARAVEAARQLTVARGRAVRDGTQGVPHAPLKRGASRGERQVEGRAGAREVLAQLLAGASEYGACGTAAVVLEPTGLCFRGGSVAADRKEHRRQPRAGGREGELAEPA